MISTIIFLVVVLSAHIVYGVMNRVSDIVGADLEQLMEKSSTMNAVLFADLTTPDGLTMSDAWSAVIETTSCSTTNLARAEEQEQDCAVSFNVDETARFLRVNINDHQNAAFVEVYNIIPGLYIVRGHSITLYNGPSLLDSLDQVVLKVAIATYLKQEARPSVHTLSSLQEVQDVLVSTSNSTAEDQTTHTAVLSRPVVIAFFSDRSYGEEVKGPESEKDKEEEKDEDVDEDEEDSRKEFHDAADALRTHIDFYIITNSAVIAGLNMESIPNLPAIFLVVDEGKNLLPYAGLWNEEGISEWIVFHSSSVVCGQLSQVDYHSSLFSNGFFGSNQLKFMLFLPSSTRTRGSVKRRFSKESVMEAAMNTIGESADTPLLSRKSSTRGQLIDGKADQSLGTWCAIAQTYKDQAIFAYMYDSSIPNVRDVFESDLDADVDLDLELPLVTAYFPTKDYKYRKRLQYPLDEKALRGFVAGVLHGKVERMLRSERERENVTEAGEGTGPLQLIGSNVVHTLTSPGTDVLLLAYTPSKSYYAMRADYELLAEAFSQESRLVIARIDLSKNDLPSALDPYLLHHRKELQMAGAPVLLWFAATSETLDGNTLPLPQKYGEHSSIQSQSLSLHDMMSFVLKKSSFLHTSPPLQIPSEKEIDILFSKLDEKEGIYVNEYMWRVRNENRNILSNAWLDWAAGEVVFDGKRWHIAAVIGMLLAVLIDSFVSGAQRIQLHTSKGKQKKEEKDKDKDKE